MRLRRSLAVGVLALSTATTLCAPRAARALECPPDSLHPSIWTAVAPAVPCAGDSLALVVNTCGGCIDLIGWVRNDSGLVVRSVWLDPAICSLRRCVPETISIPLGRFAAGRFTLHLVHETDLRIFNDHTRTDSLVCKRAWVETLEFGVARDCAQPPDSLPYVESITIGRGAPCATCPPVACAGDSIPVVVRGDTRTNCVTFLGIELLPSPIAGPADAPFPVPPIVRLQFGTNDCLGVACNSAPHPFEARVMLPPLPAAASLTHVLAVEAQLRRYTCGPGYDSTRIGRVLRPFTVKPCEPGLDSCFLTRFRPTRPAPERCDAFVAPGQPGKAVFEIGSSVPLYGLQGRLVLDPPQLVIRNLRAIGAAAGMHLRWEPAPDGAKFVLFSDGDSHIPAVPSPLRDTTRLSILEIEVGTPEIAASADTVPLPAPRVTLRAVDVTGSDADHGAIGPCPIMTLVVPFDGYVVFCRPRDCDFTGDGRQDVLDLVAMVRCLRYPALCPPGERPDCDGDGAFELDDVFCCARHILRPRGPVGGERPDPSMRLVFGAPIERDGALELPVTLSSDQAIGGARLSFAYPSDRYSVRDVRFDDAGGAGWLSLYEESGGALAVGMVNLGDATAAPNVRHFTLVLGLQSGRQPGGEVALESADLAAADGAALVTDLGDPRVSLRGGVLDLAAAQPNPFAATTRFAVTLARAGELALTVHDVGGRVVATLQRGALPAGAHTFRWDGTRGDGTRAADGIYFVRARFEGATLANKVVLLRQR